MAEYLNKVKGTEEYIPVLIWTSKEYQERKNVEYLVMKKIKSDFFESYLMEILKSQKALIVVFLEYDLGIEDFEQEKKTERNVSFINKLRINSKVDYFQSVESPYETIIRLYKGYNRICFKPGNEFHFKEKDLVIVEFQKIKSQRAESLKSHGHVIEDINEKLLESGSSWICIYTGKKYNINETKSKQLNSWVVENDLQEKPIKAISLYQDEFTGLTLMTKGSIQLQLPSHRSSIIKILENYLGASVKSSHRKVDFVIWFLNYTLTFHLSGVKDEWKISGAKLLNGNGDSLMLTLIQEDMLPGNNCYVETTELKSNGKPLVKIILSKYKFVRLRMWEEQCRKPYGFYLTFSALFLSIVTVFICWKKVIDKLNFPVNVSFVTIPAENLLAMSTETVVSTK